MWATHRWQQAVSNDTEVVNYGRRGLAKVKLGHSIQLGGLGKAVRRLLPYVGFEDPTKVRCWTPHRVPVLLLLLLLPFFIL